MEKLLFIISLILIPSTKGAFFLPTAYTLPDGLRSVNGSNSTGGCPGTCLKISIAGTIINVCDCEGSLSSPARGVLIDNTIPNIDTTQRGIWASELFVVNRSHQNSFKIGFEFNTKFYLRNLEVTYLDCQIWSAGISSINVYSSHVFPTFVSTASTKIGALSLIDDTSQSCTSLTTASISVQQRESSSYFYIEFFFVGGSSTYPLNWLHLAEIKFSDVESTTIIPSVLTLSSSSFQDFQTTTLDQMGECSLICSNIKVTKVFVTASASTAPMVTTNVTTFSSEALTTSGSINNLTTFSVTILGALTGVIVFLTALLIIVCASFIACFIIYKRYNVKRLKSLDPHYVVIGNHNNGSTHELRPTEIRPSSTVLNSLYQPSTVSSLTSALSLMAQPENQDQTNNVLYNEIRDVWVIGNTEADNNEESDEYSDSNENHYALIPEMYTLATNITKSKPENEVEVEHMPSGNQEGNDGTLAADNKTYTLVRKHQLLPPVPKKCSELQQYLELKDTAKRTNDMQHAEFKEDSKGDKYQYSEVEATAQEINEQSHCSQGESTDCEPRITDLEGSGDGYVGKVKNEENGDEVIASA